MIGARFLAIGCACWLIVVLIHIAEWQHLFPGMGWGLPDSPGHYLDLFSAIGGGLLLLAAFLARLFSKLPTTGKRAEDKWASNLRHMRSGSFLDKIRNLFQ